MSKKFYAVQMEKEVDFGDFIAHSETIQEDGVSYYHSVAVKLNEKNVAKLLEKGWITPLKSKKDSCITPEKLIQKFAHHLHCSFKEATVFLKQVYVINPTSFNSMCLKKIAIALDSSYPDHIFQANQIYGISTITDDVIPLYIENIKDLKGIAAFRSKEEAEYAKTLIKDTLAYLATNGDQ